MLLRHRFINALSKREQLAASHLLFVRREPLLLPATAFACGILCAHLLGLEWRYLIWPTSLCLLIAAIVVLSPPAKRLRLAVLCSGLALVGAAVQIGHRETRTPKLNASDGDTVLLTGCITNPPVFSPAREQFTLNLTPKAAARITVNLKPGDQPLALKYGQQVELPAKIRTPRNFQNPDSFDYVHYLAVQRIYWTGSVSNPQDIKILPATCGSRALGALFAVRTWALARLARLYPNDQHTVGLLQATLLGETSGVERRWTEDFRITGTYHALVISGQHVSVLAFTILLLLRLLRLRKIQALCVATLASWLYAFISGFSSPVVRAAGGFTLFLLASYCFRRLRILNTLSVVGIIYLVFDPEQLFDPSFQLSFLSAAAIAAFAIPLMERYTEPLRMSVKRFDQPGYDPRLAGRAAEWRVELRLLARTLECCSGLSIAVSRFVIARTTLLAAFVADVVLVSACVQFGLALPMITYFHRLSITGLSANIVVIPLLSLVVPLGFASIATGWHFLANITRLLLQLSEIVATWHAKFEPAWRIAAIPLAVSLTFAASLLVLAFAIRHKRGAAVASGCALAQFATICWQPWPAVTRAGMLEVTAIDVSQGDSLLVAFPDGETMLVDAGGFPGFGNMKRKPQIDIGEDVVSPYLWSRRIKRLDYAVLTHGHSDHMGGLAAILDNLRPRVLWIGAEPETAEWRAIQQAAARDGVRIVPLTRSSGDRNIGGAQIRILAPSSDYVPEETAKNNDSLVLELTYGRYRALLTGDAEQPIENELAAAGLLRPVTLLKVGHHGSKTSSSQEFLDLVKPQFAMISDGYLNTFHHPNPSVLERLREHHAAILRTDQRGLITFRTDGKRIELETFH
jgi:competence protein ComEC